MSNPFFPNWREISDQILSFLPPAWRANLAGKVLKRLTVAYALVMEQAYAAIAQVLRLSVIATSEGEWLRALVNGFGMSAFDGTYALVTVRFIRYGAVDTIATIPVGTQVGAVNGTRFRTIKAESIPIGSTYVDIECEAMREGVVGNVAAGEIVSLLTPVDGISEVRNPNHYTRAGVDAEPDAEIKARVPKHLESLHRGTIPATEYAISLDPKKFPEVRQFLTRRNYGTPGYFLGILADTSGGDDFRPKNWTLVGDGIYVVSSSLATVNGLVAYGFPAKRFGAYSRDASGEEVWKASSFIEELKTQNWGFVHDRNLGRIYARADGRDLNSLDITIVSGVLWRARRELELNWAANGVFLDVVAPFAVERSLTITYTLEPDYLAQSVAANLSAAATAYVASLDMGENFEAESLYARLATVGGAAGVLVDLENVDVPEDSVFRLIGNPFVVRRT